MSNIERRNTFAGLCYVLEEQRLVDYDPIEVYRWGNWHRGRLVCNGNPASEPWFISICHSFAIGADMRVRLVEPDQPPVSQAIELSDTLKDWELRVE